MKQEAGKLVDLKDRLREFALRVIKMYADMPKTTVAQVLGKQLLRSISADGGAIALPKNMLSPIRRIFGVSRTCSSFGLLRPASMQAVDRTARADHTTSILRVMPRKVKAVAGHRHSRDAAHR
jgi:hypothetical protein